MTTTGLLLQTWTLWFLTSSGPLRNHRYKDLLHTLERIKTHFLVALSSDNVRLSKLIRNQLQTVHGEVQIIKDTTTAIRKHQEGSKEWTKEQKLILLSISTLDFSAEISSEELSRLKQGASKLLNHKVFNEWRTGGSSLLLSGEPGTGKTSICRVVENYLRSSAPSSETFVVAIYFSYTNRHRLQSLQAVLTFIVETMLRVRPQFQKHYNRLMLTGEGPLEVTDCLRIIHRARQDFQHFYTLLDALDECDAQQARDIVERLTQLRSPLKILATSRPNPLACYFFHQVTIEGTVSDNMKEYIRKNLAEKVPVIIAGTLKNDPAKIDKLVDAIAAQSDGLCIALCVLSFREIVLVIACD